ncbi:Rha family transcriptional regulator [Tatumella sp. TA1]|nr:Rha family transcriptional regulator [Tatumella sp. TA1]
MNTNISIRVPKEVATPAEFAEWEGISRGSVYQRVHDGRLAKYMKPKRNKNDRSVIYYLKYKHDQICESLGHANFEIVVGQQVQLCEP